MSAPVTEQAAALTVEATSRELHLPTVRQQAAALAEAALRERLSHLGYLAEVLQAELDDRDERRRERRIREARFPRLKYLADFDLAAARDRRPDHARHARARRVESPRASPSCCSATAVPASRIC